MTLPSPETVEREKDKLYVTDAELIRRLGVPVGLGRKVLAQLDSKPSGFPRKQKIWGDRRYWPAVKSWLDSTNGMLRDGAARVAPESRNDRIRPPRHSSLRHPAEGNP